jgi:hypothetical protein
MANKIVSALGPAISPLGSILGIFDKKTPAPTPAPAATPRVMPIADDEAVRAAKRRSIASQRQRGGRSSTILTGGSTEKLGG